MSNTPTRGFTKTGQPIMGRRYTIFQEGNTPEPVEIRLTAKFYGPGGNADLVGIQVEVLVDAIGEGRAEFPWPFEAAPGSEPIVFEAAP